MVKIEIEVHQIDFILDTEAAISTWTHQGLNHHYRSHQKHQEVLVLWTPRINGQQMPSQAPVSVHARGSRPPSGKRLLSKLGTTVSVDLGLPDVSTLLVLTLKVSLEEEWCIHTPRDNKPVSPQPFLDHLGSGSQVFGTRTGKLGWQQGILQYWSPSNQELT
jgi:hypothetical protein